MADYIVSDTSLTAVADAIREKTGKTGQMAFPNGFVSELEEMNSCYSVDDLCNATIPSGAIEINNATIIDGYAFMGRNGITSVSSDTVETICMKAFSDCKNLLDVSFPNLVTLRHDMTTTINSSTGNIFGGCTSLRSVYMPKLKYINCNGAFNSSQDTVGCGTADLVIVMPSLEGGIAPVMFAHCGARLYDFGVGCSAISADAFYGRSAAFQRNRTVILRRTASVVSAYSKDSIREITDVYCPQDLISQYQSATNWSTRYTDGYITFHAIEGSQYETQYADGTPIPTT